MKLIKLFKKLFAPWPEYQEITDLDHDIFIQNSSTICTETDETISDDDAPIEWVSSYMKWEVTLCEDNDFYYARIVYHEDMWLWNQNWNYILCKFAKKNIDGDLHTNRHLRYEILYFITEQCRNKSYKFTPCIEKPRVDRINGHYVAFGLLKYTFKDYYVICDKDTPW